MKTYLKFACVYCGQHIECETRLGGRQILCPTCLHKIVIPVPHGGGAARLDVRAPFTWNTDVPLPQVEIPTHNHRPLAVNSILAQRA